MEGIRIQHTHPTGAVIHGAARGDAASLVITSVRDGWRYSREAGGWYLPRTCGRLADRARIERVAEALHAAGFPVAVRVQDTSAPSAEAGTGRVRFVRCHPAGQRSGRRAAGHRPASSARTGQDAL